MRVIAAGADVWKAKSPDGWQIADFPRRLMGFIAKKKKSTNRGRVNSCSPLYQGLARDTLNGAKASKQIDKPRPWEVRRIFVSDVR